MHTVTAAFSGFSVKSLEETKKFYSETLGLQVTQDDMGLTLHLPGSEATVFMYQKDDHQPASFTVLNLVVANIDTAMDELKSQGVTFERYNNMPQDQKGILRGLSNNMGPDIAWFKDPSGNVLSILQDR